jgi:hypothetical protein
MQALLPMLQGSISIVWRSTAGRLTRHEGVAVGCLDIEGEVDGDLLPGDLVEKDAPVQLVDDARVLQKTCKAHAAQLICSPCTYLPFHISMPLVASWLPMLLAAPALPLPSHSTAVESQYPCRRPFPLNHARMPVQQLPLLPEQPPDDRD